MLKKSVIFSILVICCCCHVSNSRFIRTFIKIFSLGSRRDQTINLVFFHNTNSSFNSTKYSSPTSKGYPDKHNWNSHSSAVSQAMVSEFAITLSKVQGIIDSPKAFAMRLSLEWKTGRRSRFAQNASANTRTGTPV